MLLGINGKLTMGKSKSSLLLSFVLNTPFLSISGCKSRYEVDLSVSVISLISSSIEYMRSTYSPIYSYSVYSESTLSLKRNVKPKN